MGKCVSKESIDKLNKGVRDTLYSEDYLLRAIDVTQVPDVLCSEKPIRARVIDVYDGDTITVVFLIGSEPVQMKIRINGIDCPEIRSGKGKLKAEKIAAKVCRDYLNGLAGDRIVTLNIHKWDKYGGRMVGDIYVNGENVSHYMIQNGYALSYDGGKKHKWTEQELMTIINL